MYLVFNHIWSLNSLVWFLVEGNKYDIYLELKTISFCAKLALLSHRAVGNIFLGLIQKYFYFAKPIIVCY